MKKSMNRGLRLLQINITVDEALGTVGNIIKYSSRSFKPLRFVYLEDHIKRLGVCTVTVGWCTFTFALFSDAVTFQSML